MTNHKLQMSIYNMAWSAAIPLLRMNQRLAEGFDERTLQYNIPKADVWIQAASAGEAYLAELILKHLNPCRQIRIMITSNTRQGKEILEHAIKSINLADREIYACTAYFPFDKPALMKKAVKAIQPRIMILLESEIWPGLLSALKQYGSKILIINGRITEKSLKQYMILPSLWQSFSPDKILAISKNDASRFVTLFNKSCVNVMPNMKFDRFDNMDLAEKNPLKSIFSPDIPFLVLGSTGEEEEADMENIILYIHQKLPDTVIGLFPRHMHRIGYWKKTLNHMNIPWMLRSEISGSLDKTNKIVILWDTFGELRLAYECSKAAFVGGSLAPLGGQNFLEALACGVIPVIGPYWDSFEWVGHEIVTCGLVRVTNNWKETATMLTEHIKNTPNHKNVREAAFKYIKERQGGTHQACGIINEFLK